MLLRKDDAIRALTDPLFRFQKFRIGSNCDNIYKVEITWITQDLFANIYVFIGLWQIPNHIKVSFVAVRQCERKVSLLSFHLHTYSERITTKVLKYQHLLLLKTTIINAISWSERPVPLSIFLHKWVSTFRQLSSPKFRNIRFNFCPSGQPSTEKWKKALLETVNS
jgi:hypothetical protein